MQEQKPKQDKDSNVERPEKDKVDTQKQVKIILHKIAFLKKSLIDLYAECPEEDKDNRAVWRPLLKEINILCLTLEKTFLLKKRAMERVVSEQKAKEMVISDVEKSIQAQEKLK